MSSSPLAPGAVTEPFMMKPRNSACVTLSPGLRSSGTALSALAGLGAGAGVPFGPTCPWHQMQA